MRDAIPALKRRAKLSSPLRGEHGDRRPNIKTYVSQLAHVRSVMVNRRCLSTQRAGILSLIYLFPARDSAGSSIVKYLARFSHKQ